MKEFIKLTLNLANDLKLNIKELLVLQYIWDFMSSGFMKSCRVDGRTYYWITYNKILEDLPVINVQKRQLNRILCSLEAKEVIFKKVISNKIFVSVNNEKVLWEIFGKDRPKAEYEAHYLKKLDTKQTPLSESEKRLVKLVEEKKQKGELSSASNGGLIK